MVEPHGRDHTLQRVANYAKTSANSAHVSIIINCPVQLIISMIQNNNKDIKTEMLFHFLFLLNIFLFFISDYFMKNESVCYCSTCHEKQPVNK